jgi:hypothetical protein
MSRRPLIEVLKSRKVDSFVVKDANGIILAGVFWRDDLQKWSFGHSKLTSDEARKIAKTIARTLGTRLAETTTKLFSSLRERREANRTPSRTIEINRKAVGSIMALA